ncbi:MAG: hypothetical protein PWP23_1428 [Candidatus Sumerlaeota bacterium]|nr:hypothetical protein [Candidatus Sumerlaeota bacterium]
MSVTKFWALALLCAAPLLVAGCTAKKRPAVLADKDIPKNGAPLTADVWQAAETSNVQVVRASNKFEWPIPLGSVYANSLAIHTSRSSETGASGESLAGRAQATSMDWNDLLTPAKNYFISLPLRGKYAEYEYRKGTGEPAGSQGIAFHPFWAWNWKDGELASGRSFDAKGIPLFYSRMEIAQKDQKMDSVLTTDNYLWTIGPRVSWFDVDGDSDELLGGEQALPGIDPNLDAVLSNDQFDEIAGYYANPLYLGGILGSILWTDYRFHARNDVWEDNHVAHGPLWGWLFYVHSRQKDVSRSGVVTGEELSRLYVAGWLWKTSITKDAQGQVVDEIEGPLLGGFGWGRKAGVKTLRLFWMPIEIGSKDASQ